MPEDSELTNGSEPPSLYYPYIHIRSEHWLKATLLCTPVVKRIVPEAYVPEDLANIKKYTQIKGPNGPLLQAVPAWSAAAYAAQLSLLDKLRTHGAEIDSRYSHGRSPNPDEYWIHDAKFSGELLDYLLAHDLAWPSQHSSAYGTRTWHALHPVLGGAVMTTLGLSIAREQGYDIVTPSIQFHETLLANREDEIFDVLVDTGQPSPRVTHAQAQHDIGQLVITLTGVNYQALQPEDIPEIQASQQFTRFQHIVRTQAQLVNGEDGPAKYEAQIKQEAQLIIEAWHDATKSLRKGLRELLVEEGLTLSGEALKSLHSGANTVDLAIAGGVAVGLLVNKGLRVKSEQKASPYQYLSEIVAAQNEPLRLTYPLGLER